MIVLKQFIGFPGGGIQRTRILPVVVLMIYIYNGGHSAYTGSDVVHYHIATNRYDQPVATEEPLGQIGASGYTVPGMSFNGRPRVQNHSWNSI